MLTDTVAQTALNQFNYDYDPAGNRTNTQMGNAITSSSANNLNQITSQSSGGKVHFRGTVNEPATVTVGASTASVDAAGNFDGVANVNVGSNTVAVIATDPSGNAQTNNYQINVPSGVNSTLLYDLNGNLTNDGDKTYEWDGINRCTAINQGTHRTEFTYNGASRRAKLVEKNNGSVTSTKQFVWCSGDVQPCEERDGSNNVINRFYMQGEQINGSSYYYSRDHLGSIRELTDSAGTIRARYDYDPSGRRTKLNGDSDENFGFTGYYVDSQYPGLAFPTLRVYSLDLGGFLSRDPIGENGGINLYGYVGNNSINAVDPSGLAALITVEGDAGTGITVFDPRPQGNGGPYFFPSSNSIVSRSEPGAAGPYTSPNVYVLPGPHNDNPRSYGPNAIIETDDPRYRWIHGGGLLLDNPLAPHQGWYPTHGCTRMQNEDIDELTNILFDWKSANPGQSIPYQRYWPSPYLLNSLHPGITPA